MKITKAWFYKLSDILKGDEKIEITDNIEVSLFDRADGNLRIEVWAWSKLQYFSYFTGKKWEEKMYNKEVVLMWDKAESYIQSMNYSEENDLSVRIWSESLASDGRLDTNILSFAGKGGKIAVDGILRIEKETTGNKWELDEENIFLWDDARISGIPTLYVETNDMEAGHACRMERISDEKLFYLRSRGLGKENALAIMIEAKIKNIFSNLEEIDADFHKSLMGEILETIQ